jgi:predicted nuclease of predicted toxin-antitoxin system
VNFLVDAQLPRRLAYRLRDAGHDVLHTLDLPAGNRTSDAEINELSTRSSRVVTTKDTDFVDSFLLFHRPYKLLLISTGNITNSDLEDLFMGQITTITTAFESYDYLELTRDALIFHS